MIKNIRWTFAEVYKEFSVKSTISALKYTSLARTKFGRVLWIIILLAFLGFATVLAISFYERHQSSMSTVILNDKYPTSMMKLPALTVCHGGIAMMHKLLPYMSLTSPKRIYIPRGLTRADLENSTRYLRETIYQKNYFPDELNKLHQILLANRLTLFEFIENINANCNDFLLMCQFEEKTVPCSKLFESVVTFYGMCCAFNYEYSCENSQRFNELLKRSNSARGGSHFVLSLLMKSYSSEDRIASTMYGDGVMVLVHERNIHPSAQATQFIAPAGHETIAQLGGYQVISASDCMTGCYTGPKWENQYDEQICDLTYIPCLARAVPRMASLLEQDWQCACLPDCEKTTYTVALATAPLNAAQYSPKPFYKEVLRYQNVTALHLTFAKQTAMLLQRQMMIPKTHVLSYVGGIFSLFLGCSVISFVEVIYYLCIFFTNMFRNKNI